MVDFDRFEEKVLEGFGSGAVSFAVLEAVSTMSSGTSFLGPIGYVFFGALTILGIVTGLGRSTPKPTQ
ncbi:MAG: hypothetical protein QXW39_06150 [Candidatus Bathyarchaeia archaeon]